MTDVRWSHCSRGSEHRLRRNAAWSTVSVGCEHSSHKDAGRRERKTLTVANVNQLASTHQTSVHYTELFNTTLCKYNTKRNDSIRHFTKRALATSTRKHTPTWLSSVTTCAIAEMFIILEASFHLSQKTKKTTFRDGPGAKTNWHQMVAKMVTAGEMTGST